MEYLIDSQRLKIDPGFSGLISNITSSKPVKSLVIQDMEEDIWQKLPFEYFGHIEEIKIFRTDINDFFKKSSYLPELKYLAISQSGSESIGIQVMEKEFVYLTNLTNLYIESTKLAHIPNDLYKLQNIENLTLVTKCVIPDVLYLLPNLESLKIEIIDDNMDRKKLLEAISKIKGLNSFYFGDSFSSETLGLRDNLLSLENFAFGILKAKELPSILPHMTKLKYLHLSNDLQSIPEWIVNLKNLEYLTIESLADGKLPIFLKQLPHLHTINLMGCLDIIMDESRIEKIKDEFDEFKVLGVNATN